MAGTAITTDDARVDAALAALYAAADDLAPVLKNIGEHEAAATKRRFFDGKDPEGNPWAALNPLYRKTKKGPGILRGESGDLAREIVWQMAGDSAVDIGSNIVYARIHNLGGVITPKNAAALVFSMGGQTFKVKSVTMPQRQFLGWSAADIEEVLAIVQDHFVMAAEKGAAST